MSYFTIGFKLFIFNILFTLDICPFYWKLIFEQPDDCDGIMLAVGPLWIAVLA